MGTIEITTEPHELIIDGTTILMQADPTASKEWVTLLEIEVPYAATVKERDILAAALAALAETPEDAETLMKLDLGVRTLKRAAEGYVKAVTGFPTQPAASSKKR